MKIPTWLKTVLSFVLAGILVYWSYKQIPSDKWTDITQAVAQTKWHWIILSMCFAVMSHISRAIRWKQMLETFKPVNLGNIFSAQGVGYLVNMALPRVGEATRIGLVSRTEKISIDKVIGTVFNDRIIDVLFLFLVTAVAVLLEYKVIIDYASKNFGDISGKFATINFPLLIGIGIIALILLFIAIKYFGNVGEKIKAILSNILQGVTSVFKLENKAMFIFHSLFIWLMYFFMIAACMQSMSFTTDLSLSTALVLLAFGTWGFIVTPGGIGAYPIVISSILVLYGKDASLGLAFGWVIWAAQSLLNILMGALSFAYLGMKK